MPIEKCGNKDRLTVCGRKEAQKFPLEPPRYRPIRLLM